MTVTIQNLIDICRFQLQDEQNQPYRYADTKFLMGLDIAFDEAWRMRPDFFVKVDRPTIIGMPTSTVVPIPDGYRMAFVFYMCGFVAMSDQEDTNDQRATIFLNKFVSQLSTTAA